MFCLCVCRRVGAVCAHHFTLRHLVLPSLRFLSQDPVESPGLGKVFAKKASEGQTDKQSLDQTTTSARDAFLKFQRDTLADDPDGSRFFHRSHQFGGAGSSSSSGGDGGGSGGSGGRRHGAEDPLTKYTRLQAELADLRAELSDLSSKSSESADLFTTIKAQEATELSAGAHALQTQLEQLGENQRFQPFLAPSFDGQSAIVSQQLLQKIKQIQQQQGPDDAPADGAAGGGAAGDHGNNNRNGVTYELFFNKDLQKQHGRSSLNTLENRLYELEQLVGVKTLDTSSVGSVAPAPLADVVGRLEERVRLLDPATLSRLHSKMDQLNKEFDTFAAKRKKAKAPNVELSGDIHRERVDELFNTAQQWGPVAETIPTLISRMQTLKALHEESALFSQRLYALENMQDGLKKVLASAEKALTNVQLSLRDNLAAVQDNVAAVDQRIAAVKDKVVGGGASSSSST
jgi:hypothetical protein